jgi:hypothetical protein
LLAIHELTESADAAARLARADEKLFDGGWCGWWPIFGMDAVAVAGLAEMLAQQLAGLGSISLRPAAVG